MPLRVGFVGGGGITETHARAVRESSDLEITAFCGTNAGRTKALARDFGGRAFASMDEMLDRYPHVVVSSKYYHQVLTTQTMLGRRFG